MRLMKWGDRHPVRCCKGGSSGKGGKGGKGGGGASLVTEDNVQKLREENGRRGTDEMLRNELRVFEQASPEARELIQSAINNGLLNSDGTGITDRIDLAVNIANGVRRITNRDIGQLEDMIGMTQGSGVRGGYDAAQRALSLEVQRGYPRYSESQRNRLANTLNERGYFGPNSSGQMSRLGDMGRDLERRANLVNDARNRAIERMPF